MIAADGKTELNPKDAAWPCGLIAKTVFNDTYVLKNASNTEIKISD